MVLVIFQVTSPSATLSSGTLVSSIQSPKETDAWFACEPGAATAGWIWIVWMGEGYEVQRAVGRKIH